MEGFIDYYEVLQVSQKAEPEVIEAAYKKLAQKYHPDLNKNPNATEKMKLLNVAHDIIGNAEKRKLYDLTQLSQQNMSTLQKDKVLVIDHKWHNVEYKELRAWAKKRKMLLEAGKELKGRHFRYRLNKLTNRYQYRLRLKYKAAIYSPS